ncbi:MAG TPA: exosortase H [Nitrospirota bacterium]|nr:exosortase H [Nitrospirota bacterium]
MGKRKSRHRRDKKRALVIREDAPDNTVLEAARYGRLRAIAAFTLACIGLYALIHALPSSFTRPFNEHTASMLGLVLNAMGFTASTAGDVVSENGLAVRIIPECTPIFASILFVCFVAFHPSSWRQKGTALAWGIPVLYLGNVFRLVATFVISRYDIRLFDVTHVYLGQVFTLLLVLSCCILWMRSAERCGTREGSSPDTTGLLTRFGLISSIVFLVWLRLNHGYILLLDRLMVFGLSLFGRPAGLAHETAVYYETFSIVIAVSLVLAASSIPWRQRIRLLGAASASCF